jgi:hypothetical protein
MTVSAGVDGHRTLPHAILAASSAQPGLPVVFHSAARGEALPLAELVERASRYAAAFRRIGVVPGDTVRASSASSCASRAPDCS